VRYEGCVGIVFFDQEPREFRGSEKELLYVPREFRPIILIDDDKFAACCHDTKYRRAAQRELRVRFRDESFAFIICAALSVKLVFNTSKT
jgi:hypothetical protein